MNKKSLKTILIMLILLSGILLIEMNIDASGWWCACINEAEANYVCDQFCSGYGEGGCEDVYVNLGSCMCYQNVCFCKWRLVCNSGHAHYFATANSNCWPCY